MHSNQTLMNELISVRELIQVMIGDTLFDKIIKVGTPLSLRGLIILHALINYFRVLLIILMKCYHLMILIFYWLQETLRNDTCTVDV